MTHTLAPRPTETDQPQVPSNQPISTSTRMKSTPRDPPHLQTRRYLGIGSRRQLVHHIHLYPSSHSGNVSIPSRSTQFRATSTSGTHTNSLADSRRTRDTQPASMRPSSNVPRYLTLILKADSGFLEPRGVLAHTHRYDIEHHSGATSR